MNVEAESSLIEHLIELRARLMRALIGLGVVVVALLPFSKRLYSWLAEPMLAQLP
ncbi:twin-arginine translocase subunit TatC, partial [uncultured Xanthomonas sp.]